MAQHEVGRTMTFGFHPEAEAGFLDAIEYSESCSPGLGGDFSSPGAFSSLCKHPVSEPGHKPGQTAAFRLLKALERRVPTSPIVPQAHSASSP
jgi:hypothetical protein